MESQATIAPPTPNKQAKKAKADKESDQRSKQLEARMVQSTPQPITEVVKTIQRAAKKSPPNVVANETKSSQPESPSKMEPPPKPSLKSPVKGLPVRKANTATIETGSTSTGIILSQESTKSNLSANATEASIALKELLRDSLSEVLPNILSQDLCSNNQTEYIFPLTISEEDFARTRNEADKWKIVKQLLSTAPCVTTFVENEIASKDKELCRYMGMILLLEERLRPIHPDFVKSLWLAEFGRGPQANPSSSGPEYYYSTPLHPPFEVIEWMKETVRRMEENRVEEHSSKLEPTRSNPEVIKLTERAPTKTISEPLRQPERDAPKRQEPSNLTAKRKRKNSEEDIDNPLQDIEFCSDRTGSTGSKSTGSEDEASSEDNRSSQEKETASSQSESGEDEASEEEFKDITDAVRELGYEPLKGQLADPRMKLPQAGKGFNIRKICLARDCFYHEGKDSGNYSKHVLRYHRPEDVSIAPHGVWVRISDGELRRRDAWYRNQQANQQSKSAKKRARMSTGGRRRTERADRSKATGSTSSKSATKNKKTVKESKASKKN